MNAQKKKSNITLAIALSLAIAGAAGLCTFAAVDPSGIGPVLGLTQKSIEPVVRQVVVNNNVSALGRLEPLGEIVCINAPGELRFERVGKLLVKTGEHVNEGQPLAVLECYERLLAAKAEAAEKVNVAEARLAQVKAGAKRGAIRAQRSTVEKLEAELAGRLKSQDQIIADIASQVRFTEAEFNRYQVLQEQGAVSASILGSKRFDYESSSAKLKEALATKKRLVETIQNEIASAGSTLEAVREVRDVDVKLAEAEVGQALASRKKAEAELALATIRAPKSGTVLKTFAKEGESEGEKGLLELGDTEHMVAVAEVYQSDLVRIMPGASAELMGEQFEGKLHGKVFEIGKRVIKQKVFGSDAGANFDERVVEVKVLLDQESSKKVSQLSNAQVRVIIRSCRGQAATLSAARFERGVDGCALPGQSTSLQGMHSAQ